MSNSVASGFSSRIGGRRRNYNIDEKYAKSPYLTNPIGKQLDKRRRSERSSNNSIQIEQKPAKSPRRRNGDSSDVESVLTKGSVRSYRTNQTSLYRRSISSGNTGRMMNLKNLLLPRDVDKLLRGFRQKNSNHPILKNRPNSGDHAKEDDDSTIGSVFALSIDDEAVYIACNEDEQVKEAIFSSDLFAAITMRNAGKQSHGQDVKLPSVFPVVTTVDIGGDVSDLESVHSAVAENVRITRSKGRKKR